MVRFSRMRRFGQYLVALSLILAVGGHWAFLQSVAWVGMAVNYSQDASLLVALQKTFSGEHPCKLCKAVGEGKKAESQQETIKIEIKLEFLELASALILYPPLGADRLPTDGGAMPGRSGSPPTPPPRFA
jgi:hypothetical protein